MKRNPAPITPAGAGYVRADTRYEEEAAWAAANPEKAAQLKEWFSGVAPKVDWAYRRLIRMAYYDLG